MHIKQVIISGFRSFRTQNEIESFSPKHNVIVGRNGSGKSNFFDAIQFVLLGPKFANLRQEDRQHLLHEGAGSSVMAAYVEIIFDNSDGRLSIESDEVILRRTVGHKKDEFFLNRKRVQKSEVSSLLESAGFSKSNPYYIVQQGKVANLCVMKDKDRLQLLKEVAGTTVYEERRQESMKIMQETANKQEKVEEVLTFIEERLSELEQEKKELVEYEQLDRQRRALEFCVYDKEYVKANEQLQQIETVRDNERERQQELYAKVRAVQDEMAASEDAFSTSRLAFGRLQERRSAKSAEVTELVSKVTSLEVAVRETEAAAEANIAETSELNTQLTDVAQQIRECEEKLSAIEPEFEAKSDEVNNMKNEMIHIRTRVEALYGKQGRGKQFSSRQERDAFLQTQIDNLSAQIEQKSQSKEQLDAELRSESERLESEKRSIQQMQKQQRSQQARLDELSSLIHEQTQHRNLLQEQRKSGWKELEALQERLQESNQELDKGKQQLNRSLPRHLSQGLEVVERIVREKNIRGYYGPLIDNITLRADAFRNAVEVAAGNALFHVIVDTDETAAFLMKELDRLKTGRLTFLPLNRLQNPNIKYPDSNDVRPLMHVALEFEPRVEAAVKQVFGSKLLARDLDVAAHYSKEFNLDAITKDGDQVNRKGGFEGGYHDERVSRIAAVVKIRESNLVLAELGEKERELQQASEAAEVKVSEVMRELLKLEHERDHLRQNINQQQREITSREKQLGVSSSGLQDRSKGIATLEQEIQLSVEQKDSFAAEQAAPMVHKLSDKERTELRQLEERQRSMQGEVDREQTLLMGIASKKDRLTADMENNLLKRQEELQHKISGLYSGDRDDDDDEDDPEDEDVHSSSRSGSSSSSSSSSSRTGKKTSKKLVPTARRGKRVKSHNEQDFAAELANMHLERDHLRKLLATAQAELKEMDAAVAEKLQENAESERFSEEQRTEEIELQEKVAEAAKMLDKLLNKRSMLLDTVQSRQRLIRDLGSLPRKEMEQFQQLNEKSLMGRLKAVNENLKKYASVNRKALDQFISFNQQREMLVQRKEEMDRDSTSIQQLIDSLDAQKDEAIQRTFRSVSKHFSDVFRELVTGGSGELIMRTTLDDASNESEPQFDMYADENTSGGLVGSSSSSSGASNLRTPAVSTFQGVQVRVTFTGSGQQYHMQQLSGGQKALVALALIFAIQRCDPAPFYLFDEIDQALDANYRAGVARLIRTQVESESAPAQFITTTFRPELVAAANKCYGIALMRKVSNIHPLEKEDAQNFVTNLLLEEEAVGKISSVPEFSNSGRNRSRAGSAGGGEEEVKSPSKFAVSSNPSSRRRLGSSSRFAAAGTADDEDDDNDDNAADVAGDVGGEDDDVGMIELDGEEERAFANLGLGGALEAEED